MIEFFLIYIFKYKHFRKNKFIWIVGVYYYCFAFQNITVCTDSSQKTKYPNVSTLKKVLVKLLCGIQRNAGQQSVAHLEPSWILFSKIVNGF